MNSGSIRDIRSSLILLLDTVAITAIFSLVYFWRIEYWPNYQSLELWLVVGTFIAVLFLGATYFRQRTTSMPSLPIRTFWVCVVAGLVCVGWLYILGPSSFNQYFGRGVLPLATLLSGFATTLIRFAINRIYHIQQRGTEFLYLGYSENGEQFLQEVKNHSEVHCITVADSNAPKFDLKQVVSSKSNLEELSQDRSWSSIIIDPEYNPTPKETDILVKLRLSGTQVFSLADFYERQWFMIPVTSINHTWFLRSQGFSVLDNIISKRLKRAFDLLLSIAVLGLTLPIVLLCGLLIKITSRGPIFYRQTRVGIEGKHFTIIKLRTMRDNAEQGQAQWAQTNDPRITWIGRILRDTRIDEIPQCWNVLKGDMSFIGPRPERPEFTQELSQKIPYYDLRHLVKPGITGWAQVIFPYGASVEDSLKKLQYELYYIKNQSFLLDANITLRTLITVFQRKGR